MRRYYETIQISYSFFKYPIPSFTPVSMSYNPLIPLFILVLRLSQLCTVSTYSYFLYPVILSRTPSLYEHFLTSWHINLYFPCFSPGFHPFSKEPHSVQWGTVCSFPCGCQEECFQVLLVEIWGHTYTHMSLPIFCVYINILNTTSSC